MAAVTRREYAGGAAATDLSASINDSTLTIPITSGTGWPTGAQGPFYIVIGRGTATEEKVLCDSRSGNTITANASGRGVDDTSAASHDSGAAVEHAWTAQDADDVNKVAAALTTKGDILGFSTEPVRIAVGANGTVPVAKSGDAEGLAWQAPQSLGIVAYTGGGGGQSITAGSETTLTLDEDTVTTNCSLASNTLTVDYAGVYRVRGSVSGSSASTASSGTLRLKVGGVTQVTNASMSVGSSFSGNIGVVDTFSTSIETLTLTAGDDITLTVELTGGSGHSVTNVTLAVEKVG